MSDTVARTSIRPMRTPGLGNTSYVVASHGIGILVDPPRDVERFLDAFVEMGVEPRWVVETHIHNDYISGGLEAARMSGAELLVPAGAAPVFRHTPAFHLEDHRAGAVRLRPIHTPGHTPEHTVYLLAVDGIEVALFSGGSLLVGSSGRADLLGEERANTLARLQYRSLQRLASLSEDVGLCPTHGAGSFCTVSAAGAVTSTIGVEKASNPALGYDNEEDFVKGQLSNLQPYPSYYRHMGPMNLAGGEPMPTTDLQELDPADVAASLDSVTVIDVRGRHEFADGHIPGSLGIELRHDFATWVGWIVGIEHPLVLVANPGQDTSEAVVQLARIGYDKVKGVLSGLDEWKRSGHDLTYYRTATLSEFSEALRDGKAILDVRAPDEYATGHVEGSRYRYVPDLVDGLGELEAAEIWVACGSGYRATIAAGLLERFGAQPVVLASAGVSQLMGSA